DPALRGMIDFRELNLSDQLYPDAGQDIANFDLILCRNVLMYLTPAKQKEVAKRLTRCLASGGWIAPSPAEAVAEWFFPLSPSNFPSAIFFCERAVELPRTYRVEQPIRRREEPRPLPVVEMRSPPPALDTSKEFARARGLADRGEISEARAICDRILA